MWCRDANTRAPDPQFLTVAERWRCRLAAAVTGKRSGGRLLRLPPAAVFYAIASRMMGRYLLLRKARNFAPRARLESRRTRPGPVGVGTWFLWGTRTRRRTGTAGHPAGSLGCR